MKALSFFSYKGRIGKSYTIYHLAWMFSKMEITTGYVVMQYSEKESRPVNSYLRWANRIPATFKKFFYTFTACNSGHKKTTPLRVWLLILNGMAVYLISSVNYLLFICLQEPA